METNCARCGRKVKPAEKWLKAHLWASTAGVEPRANVMVCRCCLGSPANGHWLIAPSDAVRTVRRRYRGPTLILENEFVTDSGAVVVVDFMPIAERHQQVDVVRIVRGLRGAVPMRMQLVFRFDYGLIVP